jgi:BioD-like phosphotransacetylase family protein
LFPGYYFPDTAGSFLGNNFEHQPAASTSYLIRNQLPIARIVTSQLEEIDKNEALASKIDSNAVFTGHDEFHCEAGVVNPHPS